MKAHSLLITGTILGLLFFAPPAHANMIVSVFSGFAWLMVVALVPVILVETLVLWLYLGVGVGKAILAATVGNIASTVVGIPLVEHTLSRLVNASWRWLSRSAEALLESFDDYEFEEEEDEEPEPREVPNGLGGIFLLIVLFFTGTVIVELLVYMFVFADEHIAVAATLWTNLVSYGLFVLAITTLLATAFVLENFYPEKSNKDLGNANGSEIETFTATRASD